MDTIHPWSGDLYVISELFSIIIAGHTEVKNWDAMMLLTRSVLVCLCDVEFKNIVEEFRNCI